MDDSLVMVGIGMVICIGVLTLRQMRLDAELADLARKQQELEAYARHAYAISQFNTAAMRRHEADEHRQEGI